jgi:hypothetical protein
MSTNKPNSSNALIWGIVFILGAVMLIISMMNSRTGQVWVEKTDHAYTETGVADDGRLTFTKIDAANASPKDIQWTTWAKVPYNQISEKEANGTAVLSWSRTIGLWLAAMFTLFILSFLIGDNPAYKFAEAMVVGTSAGYVMVVGIWDVFVPDLLAKLFPATIKDWSLPGLVIEPLEGWTYIGNLILYIIPAIFIIMLLWQLMPSGGWISRWPIAFFIGITAGFRMIGAVEADLLAQIEAGIQPLWQVNEEGAFDFWLSFKYVIIAVATLSAMVYFFFSIEHKGLVGKTARVGIWFLMITFGASFGYTVMGRIALLAARLEFLFGEWLHFIPSS